MPALVNSALWWLVHPQIVIHCFATDPDLSSDVRHALTLYVQVMHLLVGSNTLLQAQLADGILMVLPVLWAALLIGRRHSVFHSLQALWWHYWLVACHILCHCLEGHALLLQIGDQRIAEIVD